MDSLDFLGGVGGQSAVKTEDNNEEGDVKPPPTEMSDDGQAAD